MIPFLYQTLVELAYLIFIMLNDNFGDESAKFIIFQQLQHQETVSALPLSLDRF